MIYITGSALFFTRNYKARLRSQRPLVNDILIAEKPRHFAVGQKAKNFRAAKYQTSVSRCRRSAWEMKRHTRTQLRLEQQLRRWWRSAASSSARISGCSTGNREEIELWRGSLSCGVAPSGHPGLDRL